MSESSGGVWQSRDVQLSRSTLLKCRLCFFIVLAHDLFVNRDDSLTRRLSCEPNNQPNVLTTSETEGRKTCLSHLISFY